MPTSENSSDLRNVKGTPISSAEMINIIGDLFPSPVFVYGLQSKPLLYVNDAFVRVLGYSREEVGEWTFETASLVFSDDAGDFEKGIEACCLLTQNAVHTFPCRLNRKTDGYFHVQLTCRILQRGIEGKAESVLFFVQDISQQVQQAAATSEIERKIAELKRSNKDLEEFAYIASHDMHEPLRKVHSFAYRLKEKYSTSVEEEAKGYLDRILAATQNARLMIDGLMEFSRLSRNGFGFERANMNELVQEVLTDLELKIEETETRIDVGPLPQIDVIRIQMKQLFSNVILNAIKFKKEGIAPHLSIQCKKLTAQEISEFHLDKGLVHHCFTIEDNGIGFDDEYAETIFQMFQRLNGKSEYPGSGIGLALCKKISDNHHGAIEAKSIPNKGTVITVILPEKNKT